MDVGLFFVFLMTCMVPGVSGYLFKPGAWYAGLDKPSWTPPNVLFPIVWLVLYISMSIAAARIALIPGNNLALALWGLQICINTLWSAVFFGQKRMLLGVFIIAALWLAVLATTAAFLQLNIAAAALMVPYLAWGTFAMALNISVWRRNAS
jgi:tryptophan-rich sensory protein